MITASRLSGFIAAHAVWCLSDDDSLIPMLAVAMEDGGRKLERLAMDPGVVVDYGRQRLEDDPLGANDGVLVYAARLSTDDEAFDAVLCEQRCYGFPWAKATIAIPYSAAGTPDFALHTARLLQWDECEDFDKDMAFESFFEGVGEHEKGAPVWEKAADNGR